ncbi:MAG: carnitine dehydratase [Candidatus Rokubacteria bacterium RIFCSPLOWO2_12_FULL_73_47]|nr:MAG: carnitine dehydratase [Candidatus Rokubacteria bacterium RIFCSPLOWO2_12_FULL_73_47]
MGAVTDPRGALAGVTVLDLATFLAAPLCATLLGEFGAEVIKVEQPGVGDDLRRLSRAAGDSGSSYWWLVEARNKKSITCNLRDPEGQALVRRLVAGAHVVTENFRPGTLERWHLGWDALAAVRPSLVLVRVSAFGQTGPRRARPGFGRIAAAVGGLAYLSGDPDRPPVTPGTPTVPDYLAGVFAAVGALIALRHAERTGEGQVVDVGLYEPVLRVLDDAIAVHAGTGHVRERIGSATESAVPHNHYRSRDGRWLAIACTNDRMFARLAQAMARPELARDPRAATTAARLAHRALVDGLVAAWVAAHDAADALARLEAAEVPAALVASVRDLAEDPQVRARENILSLAVPLLGRLAMPGVVPRLTRTPGRVATAGPLRPGEHNAEVYGERLGLSRAELAGLAARGVI